MKKIILFVHLSLSFALIAQEEIKFSTKKQLTQPAQLKTNEMYDTQDIIEINYIAPKSFDPKGTKKYQWTINGSKQPGKGWILPKGCTTTGEKLSVYFIKVGNYTVSLTLTVTSKKKVGEEFEEEEIEYSGESEDFITVRSVFPELAALYAKEPLPDYVKLVEKASQYSVKPKFADDPTPHLFLAKGFLGILKTGINDPRFESALEDCISSFNTARELDKNGVIYDGEHQSFLQELETYIYNEGIKDYISSDPLTDPEGFNVLKEYIDYYNQISFAPITSAFFQAKTKYDKKDTKGANAIWNSEIPKLKKFKNLDIETAYGSKFKDENNKDIIISKTDLKILKYGIIATASLMKSRDGNSTKACELIDIVSSWFAGEPDFTQFVSKELNNCVE